MSNKVQVETLIRQKRPTAANNPRCCVCRQEVGYVYKAVETTAPGVWGIRMFPCGLGTSFLALSTATSSCGDVTVPRGTTLNQAQAEHMARLRNDGAMCGSCRRQAFGSK